MPSWLASHRSATIAKIIIQCNHFYVSYRKSVIQCLAIAINLNFIPN